MTKLALGQHLNVELRCRFQMLGYNGFVYAN